MFDSHYTNYIKSKAWKLKRKFFIDYCESIGQKKCWRCNQEAPFYQVHHQSYKRLGHEDFSDFELLCFNCHKKEHSHLKISKSSAKRMNRAYIRRHEEENERAQQIHDELDAQWRSHL